MSALSTIVARGTRASQPAASSVPIGSLYFVTDENKTERSNGSTWDGFLTPGSTLVEQHTASASATLDFTTAITSTYDEYMIEFLNLIPVTNNVDGWIRFSTDGGSTYDTGSNYKYATYLVNDTGSFSTNTVGSNSAVKIVIGANTSNTAAGGGISGTLRLFSPLSTAVHKTLIGDYLYLNNDTNHYRGMMSGFYAVTTAANAFRFLFSSGNIASGTIRVYGISKS